MSQFIHDMIHMTEGEKLVHYWPLWLTVWLVVIGASYIRHKRGR
ncbi:hypothetical protein [Cohnella massiliensis]|nr:hypothetical protein [Cohnella massiliensis]